MAQKIRRLTQNVTCLAPDAYYDIHEKREYTRNYAMLILPGATFNFSMVTFQRYVRVRCILTE